MTVSTKTEQALRDAMERLLSGQSQHTDGKLTKNNLCREAEVSRATINRATEILIEWDARTATSPAGILQHRYTAASRAPRQAAQKPQGASRPSGTGRRGSHRHHDAPRGERIAT
ncbi:hypothetical protein ACFWBI_32615 [Streptomyces sp. NPDC059982]|uniref:hypothetical protein n=1 Tax=unclassified Streptomyces TaxID=2593676 RepID=UPI0036BF2680